MARRRRLVTLTTDVGPSYAAQMKGVLARSVPAGRIIDLALELAPFGIEEAAFLFEHMASAFPAGSVHLAVVDPGVGGPRVPVAVGTRDGSVLVGPDNGLLDRLATRLGVARAVRLDRPRPGARPRVGATFDGRDLFAPAAARLANGTPLSSLGPGFDYRPKTTPAPHRSHRRWSGRILHVDRFGNLVTDLPSDWLPAPSGRIRFRIGSSRWHPAIPAKAYTELPMGRFGLIPSSFGTLEVALREESAVVRLRPGSDRTVRVELARIPTARRRDGK